MSFGESVKLLRIQRGMTAKELAEKVGVSPSMISKIEHGVVNPSHDTFRNIALELHVSMQDLIDPQRNPVKTAGLEGRISVVRKDERKILQHPQTGSTYQILTPDLQGAAEFVWVESDGESDEIERELHGHGGEESMLILQGVLHIHFEDRVVVLNEGDCITFDGRLPHRYVQPGPGKVVSLFVTVPPSL
jgi:transcriptional regulator with XRE-family HTH domain